MNTYEKHMENIEHEHFMHKKQEQAYYLQRKLREKKIKYNSRNKTVNPSSDFTNDKHVLILLKEHNYTVQTIIE